MFKLFKKNNSIDNIQNSNELLSKTTSLLIHAAKIDENYTIKEKEIIKKTLIELGAIHSEVDQIIINEEINEEKSNQILDFTKEIKNKNFMLLCGFESFDEYFVRIDILERLFVKIINSNPNKNAEIKLVPEMLNLLGCSKENFLKLIKKMNYKTLEKNNEFYFKYDKYKQKVKKFIPKGSKTDNPFNILKKMSLK